MKIEEIKTKLCVYDGRNPDNLLKYSDRRPSASCNCDNCFYGRHKLADELLKEKKSNENMIKNIKFLSYQLASR